MNRELQHLAPELTSDAYGAVMSSFLFRIGSDILPRVCCLIAG